MQLGKDAPDLSAAACTQTGLTQLQSHLLGERLPCEGKVVSCSPTTTHRGLFLGGVFEALDVVEVNAGLHL